MSPLPAPIRPCPAFRSRDRGMGIPRNGGTAYRIRKRDNSDFGVEQGYSSFTALPTSPPWPWGSSFRSS